MSQDDVLFRYRLRLLTLAEELSNVSEACRRMGVSRQTYYRLKHQVDRWGLEALRFVSAAAGASQMRSARTWSSGSWPSASPTLALDLGASQPSWPGRSGAACASQSTASDACSAGLG